jgi:alcohol dehydrogenase class IV
VETLASGFASLAVDLQIPTSLQEVGIKQQDLGLLASEAIKVKEDISLAMFWITSILKQ